MSIYLFRIEAVNLDPTVYDTADISTIRGGGFYLLHKVHELAGQSQPGTHLVTEGASTAVLKVDTSDPDHHRRKILECLYSSDDDCIREMTFLVEYVPYTEPGRFAQTMAALQGKIRLRQMQTPNLRIFDETLEPARNSDTNQYLGFDRLNRVLPAHTTDHIKKEISNFTAKRHKSGQRLRKGIYRILLGDREIDLEPFGFTADLAELSKSPSQGNLDGKIAYMYIDGNKFGRLQRDFNEEQLAEYDHQLQRVKSAYLRAVLDLAHGEASFWNGSDIRLEVLLWGGDEIKLIVPGWMGWKVARLFYRTVAELDPHMVIAGEKKEMTYAMGLVFTHHKNPIRNITGIAEELAATVKANVSAMGDGEPYYRRLVGDRLQYAVLESLETLPDTYEGFAQAYYHRPATELCLSPAGMDELGSFARTLTAGLARSRIYEAASLWRPGSLDAYLACLERSIKTSETDAHQKAALRAHIVHHTGAPLDGPTTGADRGYRWLQICELWDYLT